MKAFTHVKRVFTKLFTKNIQLFIHFLIFKALLYNSTIRFQLTSCHSFYLFIHPKDKAGRSVYIDKIQ